jgi:thymidylate synthase (FAD)
MTVSLVWVTPDAEKLIAHCARVSNPANQDNDKIEGLLKYCIKNAHWSIFEMASACLEINAPRDITRQIIRHRSFSFQEFSQRYADVSALPFSGYREPRLQDLKNRQNSIEMENKQLANAWEERQANLMMAIDGAYKWALANNIAKECARVILPEGLTPSRVYMSGTIRSWLHFCQVRQGNGTQKEHIEIANQIAAVLAKELPIIFDMRGEKNEQKNISNS